jgi:hypothetical protein
MKDKPKKTQEKKGIGAMEKLNKKSGECSSGQKIMVGADEFCPNCMEWRAYDEITGKCVVCGRIIKRIGERRKITDEYDLKDFAHENDESQETGEF